MTPKKLRPRFFAALLLILAACFLPSTAPAAFVFQLTQVGSSVVVTGSGTLNLAGLTAIAPLFGPSGILPSSGTLAIDPAGSTIEQYYGLSGPADFGSGDLTLASSSSGDDVVLSGAGMSLFIDPTYVSGSPLSDSMTFTNITLSDLGFTPGTYTYTWGSGETADSLTVTSAVPEPSTWSLLGMGVVLLLGLALRSREASHQGHS